jgi:hypothetical protein
LMTMMCDESLCMVCNDDDNRLANRLVKGKKKSSKREH